MHNDIDGYKLKIEKTKQLTQDKRILLVEDDETLRLILARFLKPLFKEVVVAEDGVVALSLYEEALNEACFDLVFSDIEMPNMNGIALTKAIYTLKDDQEIIIFSAYQEAKYLVELLNLGIRRFVPKPIDMSLFLDELQMVCSKMQLKEDNNHRILLVNNLSFDKKRNELFINNEPLSLTPHEQLLFELLIQNIGYIVSSDAIVSFFEHNNIEIKTENIRKTMHKLRLKLPENSIESLYSIGYRIKSA